MPARDRDESGRARNARPRDGLGRPLPHGAPGVPPLPEDLHLDAGRTLHRAQELIDAGLPFQAHEVLEARWKTGPDRERDYWQGLAQAAVALTHLRRGNPTGARSLAHRAAASLTGQEPPVGAVPIDEICTQLAAVAAGDDLGLQLVAEAS